MAARIWPFCCCLPDSRGLADDERVEQRLVHTDLFGRHRAVVELVDLVGQLGRDLRLGFRAPEHQDAVERAHRVLGFDADRTSLARQARDELRAGADKAGVDEVEDCPQVAEAVLDRRTRERDARAAPGSGAAAGRCRSPGS